MTFGVVGIAGIFLWQWLVWYPEASEYHRRYIWQRCGFLVAVATDWPLIQMIIAGAGLRFISTRILPETGESGTADSHLIV